MYAPEPRARPARPLPRSDVRRALSITPREEQRRNKEDAYVPSSASARASFAKSAIARAPGPRSTSFQAAATRWIQTRARSPRCTPRVHPGFRCARGAVAAPCAPAIAAAPPAGRASTAKETRCREGMARCAGARGGDARGGCAGRGGILCGGAIGRCMTEAAGRWKLRGAGIYEESERALRPRKRSDAHCSQLFHWPLTRGRARVRSLGGAARGRLHGGNGNGGRARSSRPALGKGQTSKRAFTSGSARAVSRCGRTHRGGGRVGRAARYRERGRTAGARRRLP
jgi:hypothetical protein